VDERSIKGLLWVDVETTGLNHEKHGIVSLAAIADWEGQEVAAKVWHMNPVGRDIEDAALAVNGFTRLDIASFQRWDYVFYDFLAWIKQTFTEAYIPVTVAGYNHVSFDTRFIREWFSAAGGRIEEILRISDAYDVMKIVKADPRFAQLGNRRLLAVANSMGVSLVDKAHQAEADIRATRDVYYRLKAGVEPKT
jgi:DNA polymerase III epsilon subunit-like protein